MTTIGETIKSRFKRYLEENGIRESSTRDKFFDLMMEFEHHVELSEVLKKAKEFHIAEASVYRSLKLFLDAGIVTKLQGPQNKTFYEPASAHHDHMICLVCDKIIEFHSDKIETLQSQIALEFGFKIQSHRHELTGWCKDCLSSAKKKDHKKGI